MPRRRARGAPTAWQEARDALAFFYEKPGRRFDAYDLVTAANEFLGITEVYVDALHLLLEQDAS